MRAKNMKRKIMDSQINVRVKREILDKAMKKSEKEGKSFSEVIRNFIFNYSDEGKNEKE
jgi:hypothetical protein